MATIDTGGWVRGRLDGHYRGLRHGAPETLVRAVVAEPARVDAPADPPANELRWAEVEGWMMLEGVPEPIRLVDVRLRGWSHVPGLSDEPVPFGRISGEIWARVPSDPLPAPPSPRGPGLVERLTRWLWGGVVEIAIFAADVLLGVAAASALLASCGLRTAIAALAVTVLPWMLRSWFVIPRLDPRWTRTIGGAAIGAELALGTYVLAVAGAAPCDERSRWLAAALAVPVLVAATLPAEWPRFTTSIAFSVGMVVWCLKPDDQCLDAEPSVRVSGPPLVRAVDQTARQLFATWEEVRAKDEAARLAAATNERLTLDAALYDPDAFFERCGPPVVLSTDVLFALNDDDLASTSGPYLRKLRRLLAAHEERGYTVRAHLDPSGTPQFNVDLSQRQAEQVAEWLLTHSRVQEFVAEGKGSGEPIVGAVDLAHLNRRIEVAVVCE